VSYTPATGDNNNLGVAETSCGATGEQFRVLSFNPTMTTAQTVTISDSATIDGTSGGGNLDGTAHFQPFDNSACNTANGGQSLGAQQDRPVSGATSVTVSTTTSVSLTASKHVWWKVSYTSNNAAQTSIAASCVENTNVTITNS
jgi:hypothetical protein